MYKLHNKLNKRVVIGLVLLGILLVAIIILELTGDFNTDNKNNAEGTDIKEILISVPKDTVNNARTTNTAVLLKMVVNSTTLEINDMDIASNLYDQLKKLELSYEDGYNALKDLEGYNLYFYDQNNHSLESWYITEKGYCALNAMPESFEITSSFDYEQLNTLWESKKIIRRN